MAVTIVVQPVPMVNLAEAKLELGIDSAERDAQIDRFILAAQAEMDGPNGWVGISVAPQTLEYRFDDFSSDILLPHGPVIDPLVSFQYLDGEGDLQDLTTDDYVLLSDGRIILADGSTWPTPLDQEQAVRVIYDVGITDESDTRFQLMKSAILMRVRVLMDMADPAVYERTIDNLLRSLKVWSV